MIFLVQIEKDTGELHPILHIFGRLILIFLIDYEKFPEIYTGYHSRNFPEHTALFRFPDSYY